MSVKRDIRFRVYLSFTAMVLFGGAIIGKAAMIQTKEGAALRKEVKEVRVETQNLPAERGNIYSEDGTILSSTIPEFNLFVDFSVIHKDTFSLYVDSLANSLSLLFGDHTAREYKALLKKEFRKGSKYWSLKKNATYYQYQQARTFPIFVKGTNRGGFIVRSVMKRKNPYQMLAYRTIGLYREEKPNIGLEKTYDSVLAGIPGKRQVRLATGGTWMPDEGPEVTPVNGKDIVTTIDIDIQDITEHALMEVLSKYECAYGTAIVMEVETGKILALANLGRQKDGSYWEDFNYALLPSEPGSTFKLFSLLALLDDQYVSIGDLVDVHGGRRRFGNQVVVDDHPMQGSISVKNAFEVSSNVAFAGLIQQYYQKNPMKFIRKLQKFHLHKPTGIDLSGERAPMIKTTKSKTWSKTTSLPWIGYGYESLITPLHTCMVYNAVANNGRLMKPYLVSEIREFGKVIRKIEPTVLEEQIASAKAIAGAQEALRGVVESGTAKAIKSPYYHAGGKTGTAQVADKGITYRDGVRQGSFVGYFPWENPKYTIMVLARSKPHGTYYGSIVGAPVFKAIADKLYANHVGGREVIAREAALVSEIGLVRGSTEGLATICNRLGFSHALPDRAPFVKARITKRSAETIQKLGLASDRLPEVTGMGLKDALFLLEKIGLTVTVTGVGKVQSQSLAAGSKIKKGQLIHLVLG